MIFGELRDRLAHARPDLVREVGRRGPDEGVDVVDRRLVHRARSLTQGRGAPPVASRGCAALDRRGDAPDDDRALGAELTVSRYILTHGFQPLAYAATRHGLLSSCSSPSGSRRALAAHPTTRSRARRGRRGGRLPQPDRVRLRARATSASVVGLILGATPIFAALAGLALGTETLHARFWTGAPLLRGVALVALGSGGVSGDLAGVLLGVLTAATWAGTRCS